MMHSCLAPHCHQKMRYNITSKPGQVNYWRCLSKLTLIARQDALLILRSSLGAPKMIHVLRRHPSDKHPESEIYDTTQRQGLEKILNVSLNDMQWTQASLLYCIVLYSSIYIAPLNSLRQTEALLVQLAPRKETSFKK